MLDCATSPSKKHRAVGKHSDRDRMVKHEDGNQITGAIVRGGKVDLGVLNDAEEVPSSQAELDK
jgi:hypothetical protein